MAVKRTTAASPPPAPVSVPAKTTSAGKKPAKTPAKAPTAVASAKHIVVEKSALISKTPSKIVAKAEPQKATPVAKTTPQAPAKVETAQPPREPSRSPVRWQRIRQW